MTKRVISRWQPIIIKPSKSITGNCKNYPARLIRIRQRSRMTFRLTLPDRRGIGAKARRSSHVRKKRLFGERRYYNGKIGRIVFISPSKIIVSDELGNDITVDRETWTNVKYTIDENTKDITETIAGSFSQYPLKTAWAITIIKAKAWLSSMPSSTHPPPSHTESLRCLEPLQDIGRNGIE